MKKELFIILLLVIPTLSAIEIKFSKDSYQPQELFQAEITGNFISLTSDNILFYKDEKVHSEPVIKDLTKQNHKYYFYAILPNQEGNFTFRIENVRYLERGEIKTDPIIKNISIQYKNTSDLYISPGFIIPDKSFSIKVLSLYKDTVVNAKFEATGETKNVSLIEGIEEIIQFSLPALPPSKSKITINSYEIPVFLIKKQNLTIEEKIEFIPYELRGTIVPEEDYSFKVIVRNIGRSNLTNIKFSSDLNIKISPEEIKILEPNAILIINLTILISKTTNKSISDYIKAKASDKVYYLPVNFNITDNKSEINIPDSSITTSSKSDKFSCKQIGKICLENQICNGETIGSLEGSCCIGDCVEEEGSGYSNIIGVILIIILIIVVLYFIYRIMKRRKIKSPEDILKEKSDRYNQRLKGEEVRGRLDKV